MNRTGKNQHSTPPASCPRCSRKMRSYGRKQLRDGIVRYYLCRCGRNLRVAQ
jgi:DNA-directed RNA polymerase subunit M/transcription elongation factor TFIIS